MIPWPLIPDDFNDVVSKTYHIQAKWTSSALILSSLLLNVIYFFCQTVLQSCRFFTFTHLKVVKLATVYFYCCCSLNDKVDFFKQYQFINMLHLTAHVAFSFRNWANRKWKSVLSWSISINLQSIHMTVSIFSNILTKAYTLTYKM